jgi:uncharacterized lipoprotein YddW (UPF0748 family)
VARSSSHALAALVCGGAAWLLAFGAASAPAVAETPAAVESEPVSAAEPAPVSEPAPIAPPVSTPLPGELPPVAAPPSDLPSVAAPPSPAAARSPRGLWVLCEGAQRVLERPEMLPKLLDDAKALGATDLFVQVYRGGRAWYDASLADATPWQSTWRDPEGRDALAVLIDRAHAAGLRVHAWVNVLSLSKNAEAPIVRELGPSSVLVDQWGRSMLDYPEQDVPEPERKSYRIGTPAIYLDAAAPGVAERVAATFEELLRKYPRLDGLHLDYIRYPDVLPYAPGTRFGVGLSFGYGPETRARFQTETGLPAPFAENRANADRYDAWRREKLSALVARIAERARAARPGVQLSAAVYPDANRAYLGLFQDWRGWLEAGSLDVAVPMLYSTDERLFRYQVDEMAGLPFADRLWVGLGSWLFERDPARAVAQTERIEAHAPLGVAFFSWDSIHAAPALRDALAGTAPRPVRAPAADPAAPPAPAPAAP